MEDEASLVIQVFSMGKKKKKNDNDIDWRKWNMKISLLWEMQ